MTIIMIILNVMWGKNRLLMIWWWCTLSKRSQFSPCIFSSPSLQFLKPQFTSLLIWWSIHSSSFSMPFAQETFKDIKRRRDIYPRTRKQWTIGGEQTTHLISQSESAALVVILSWRKKEMNNRSYPPLSLSSFSSPPKHQFGPLSGSRAKITRKQLIVREQRAKTHNTVIIWREMDSSEQSISMDSRVKQERMECRGVGQTSITTIIMMIWREERWE